MTIFRHRVTGPLAAGDIWISTMHSTSTNVLSTVHSAWETMINSFIGGTMKALWNTHTQATEVITDELDPLTGLNVAQAASAVTQVGTGTGGTVSPSTAMVVSLFTALPKKAGRGRMFWPSPDDSHFTTSGLYVQGDCATVATGFKAALVTFSGTSQPIIFHRKTRTFDNIITVKVGDKPASQRRRVNQVANTYSFG